ncbi:eukaryotic translation initiation factor 3 subunit, putative [Entamoeba invadens IP1]|uniref:Eukaryotic translation initiation factor 3 subunit, putative n=1 Tax=Entamoeba invadens IP1 TaxID=370355 RepID=A0A0A1U075_ENTIV|nr:eukaryotic translation initiation factor 3 subunit, putative [Entamoeba invadens IP1]ELP84293.1 eukaryotic translation initiation factor 3 subunit, putative [Entamoeba invadens IP1]|eukprot:XP_004183639.1 eukaryotic translation initiation factor 3 subunit, putative [Entamoeba invadens IP1]
MSAAKQQPTVTQGSVLICDGLPTGVGANVVPKLTLFFRKMVLLKNGAELSDHPSNVEIYIDKATNKTTGVGFVDFKDDAAAMRFKSRYIELKFDNNNTLKFYTKKEIDAILKESDEYTPMIFNPIEVNDFKGWLKDEKYINGNECFALFEYGKSITLGWENPTIPTEPTLTEEQPFGSTNVAFSPAGTFLYAVTDKGLIVQQPDNKKKFQFPHPGMTHVTISPYDTFIATYSPYAKDGKHVIVWDRRFIKGVKYFDIKPTTAKSVTEKIIKEKVLSPIGKDLVQFSHDEKYLARISEVDPCSVEIYTTPVLQLLGNKLVTFETEIDQLSWSPKQNILVAYHDAAQKNNSKTFFYFYNVETGEVIYKHIVFSLRDAQFMWHPSGKKLVVRCLKPTKTTFVVFSLDKEITVASVDLNASPLAFALNPTRFQMSALVYHKNKKGQDNQFPSYYCYDITTKEIKIVMQTKEIEAKGLSYSPNGQFLIISGIGTPEPFLYFYNTDKMVYLKKVPIENMNYLAWDPIGLYVAAVRSAVYSPHAKNGFLLYDCYGVLKYESFKKDFGGLLWRPQPKNLIKDDLEVDVDKTFVDCINKMKEEDEKLKEKIELEKKEKKDLLIKRYREIVRKNTDLAKAEKQRAYDSLMKIVVEEKPKEENEKSEEKKQ